MTVETLFVVGAGVAGTVAAYVMAKRDWMYWLLNAEEQRGQQNMTGGRLYAHSIEGIMPGFAASAPIRTCRCAEKSRAAEESAVTLDFHRAPYSHALTS